MNNRKKIPALKVAIEDSQAGRRLDNFLLGRLGSLPRSRVYRMIRKGEVRVNGGRVSPEYRLCAGDHVRLPPLRLEAPPDPAVDPEAARRLLARVVHEDRKLLVLNKPPGVPVHSGTGRSFGIIDLLRAAHPCGKELQLVHRLDRDTSGCLLIAKDPACLRRLHQLLREGALRKDYLALLKGRLAGPPVHVDARLDTGARHRGERTVTAGAEGKSAHTRFVPVRAFHDATLVTASPSTGRTHQIRVHAASLTHPLAGDTRYGDRTFNRRLRRMGLKRLFLHASRVRIPSHPAGRDLAVDAPLPPDLAGILEILQGLDDGR